MNSLYIGTGVSKVCVKECGWNELTLSRCVSGCCDVSCNELSDGAK